MIEKSKIVFLFFFIIITALFLNEVYSYATDFEEYEELFNCISTGYCSRGIELGNYSYGVKSVFLIFKKLGYPFLIFSTVLLAVYALLNIKSMKTSLFVVVLSFILFYLRDYYFNAYAQALALMFYLLSIMNISTKKSILFKVISVLCHPSSVLYFLEYIYIEKVGKLMLFGIVVNVVYYMLLGTTMITQLFASLGGYSAKIVYYASHVQSKESLLSLSIKFFFFLGFAYFYSKLVKDNLFFKKMYFIYLASFFLYTSFLSIDIFANRILAIGKIFEILFLGVIYKEGTIESKIFALIWIIIHTYILFI